MGEIDRSNQEFLISDSLMILLSGLDPAAGPATASLAGGAAQDGPGCRGL